MFCPYSPLLVYCCNLIFGLLSLNKDHRKGVTDLTAKKKKAAITVILLIVIAAVIAICVSCYSPFKGGKALEIYSIYRYNTPTEQADITNKIDHDSLVKALPVMRIQRIPSIMGTHSMENAEYELAGFVGEKQFRIYIETGKNSYCQINGKFHKLKNSESWLEILEAMEK